MSIFLKVKFILRRSYFSPELLYGCAGWEVLTPAVPPGPAAHLAGEAPPHTGLEVVVRVWVTRVLREVQLLNFSRCDVVVVIWHSVGVDIREPFNWKNRVVDPQIKAWVMNVKKIR